MTDKRIFERMENQAGFEKPILTMRDAVMFTGLSVHTLYKLIGANKIKHYKPNGKMIFFRRDELISWMLQNPSED